MPPLSWRFRKKCHGLANTSFGQVGKCHAGGSHSHDLAFEYFLPYFSNEGHRSWRVCSKCRALFYSPSGQATGWCAESNNHTPLRWGKQVPEFGVSTGGQGEKKWHMCNLCFGLFWAGNGNGTCTIGGTHERSTKQYVVDHRHGIAMCVRPQLGLAAPPGVIAHTACLTSDPPHPTPILPVAHERPPIALCLAVRWQGSKEIGPVAPDSFTSGKSAEAASMGSSRSKKLRLPISLPHYVCKKPRSSAREGYSAC